MNCRRESRAAEGGRGMWIGLRKAGEDAVAFRESMSEQLMFAHRFRDDRHLGDCANE